MKIAAGTANAGVRAEGDLGAALGNRVTLALSWDSCSVSRYDLGGVALRGQHISTCRRACWRYIYGCWYAGIGFTMALFVADLPCQCGGDGAPTAASLGIPASRWTLQQGVADLELHRADPALLLTEPASRDGGTSPLTL